MWPDAGEVLRGDAGRRHGAGVVRPSAAVRDPARDPRRERRPGHLPRRQARQPRPRHHVHPGTQGLVRADEARRPRGGARRGARARQAAALPELRAPAGHGHARCATWSAASSTACSRASPAPRCSPRRPCAGASATPCASSRATPDRQAGYLYHENGFHPDEQRRLLTQLADQADVALDNLRLLHERREHETHDPLTGLLNFRQLRERAAFELARAERHGRHGRLRDDRPRRLRRRQRDRGPRGRGRGPAPLGGGAHRAAAQLRPGVPVRRRRVPAGAARDRRPGGRRRAGPRARGDAAAGRRDGRPGPSPSPPRPASQASRPTAAAPRSSSPRRRRRCTRPGPPGPAASRSTPVRRAPERRRGGARRAPRRRVAASRPRARRAALPRSARAAHDRERARGQGGGAARPQRGRGAARGGQAPARRRGRRRPPSRRSSWRARCSAHERVRRAPAARVRARRRRLRHRRLPGARRRGPRPGHRRRCRSPR